MECFKFKSSDAVVILNKGEFTEDNCDIIINWIEPTINTGSPSFKKFIHAAGEQYYHDLFQFRHEIKSGDAFTTHAGLLKANIAINCVVPIKKELYNNCFFMIKETINAYHKINNLCRFITIALPDDNYKEFVYYLTLYFKDLNFVKEFRIIVDNEKAYQNLNIELNKKLQKDRDIFNLITKLFNAFTRSRRKKL